MRLLSLLNPGRGEGLDGTRSCDNRYTTAERKQRVGSDFRAEMGLPDDQRETDVVNANPSCTLHCKLQANLLKN